jgi:RNA polymerase sigma-70 factor (ECF subfamily)
MPELMQIPATGNVGTHASVAERPAVAEEFFREHTPEVYRLALRLLDNPADAEDVTQDVLVQVLRKLPQFRGESTISTWLYRITLNTAFKYRQKRAWRVQRHSLYRLEDFPNDGDTGAAVRRSTGSPEQHVLDQEARQQIKSAIAQLPDVYRRVYVLADVEHLSNAEVADQLGLTIAAVKSRLHRARLLMRKTLARYFTEQAA